MNLKKINQYTIMLCLIAFCVSEQQQCSWLESSQRLIDQTPQNIRNHSKEYDYIYHSVYYDRFNFGAVFSSKSIGQYDKRSKSFIIFDSKNKLCKKMVYGADGKFKQICLMEYKYSPCGNYYPGNTINDEYFDENGKLLESHYYNKLGELKNITKSNPTNNHTISMTGGINIDPQEQSIGSYKDPITNKTFLVTKANYTSNKGKEPLPIGKASFAVACNLVTNPDMYSPENKKHKFSGENSQNTYPVKRTKI